MRLVSFDLDPALVAALAPAVAPALIEAGMPTGELPALLEQAEALVDEHRPDAALSAGKGEPALALALALTKARVPVARLTGATWEAGVIPAPPDAHADRLADLRICPDEAARARLESAGLAEQTVVAETERAAAAALAEWVAGLGAPAPA